MSDVPKWLYPRAPDYTIAEASVRIAKDILHEVFGDAIDL